MRREERAPRFAGLHPQRINKMDSNRLKTRFMEKYMR